jgi:ribosome-associated translation inhibitor RaiA
MKTGLEIHYHHLPASPALTEMIEEQATRIQEMDRRISRCCVAIEAERRPTGRAKRCRVRIEVGIPGQTLVVNSAWNEGAADVYAVAREAFRTMHRRVEGWHQKGLRSHSRTRGHHGGLLNLAEGGAS